MANMQPFIEVPLKIDGKRKFIRGVTKYTTCGDVLKMVLNKRIVNMDDSKVSYGLFESSRGIERLLPGKSRISKVMRTWGSAHDYELILRSVNPVISMPKISEARKRKISKVCAKPSANGDNNKENKFRGDFIGSSDIPSKRVSRLQETVQTSSNGCVQEIYFSDSDNTMHKVVSRKYDGYMSYLGDNLNVKKKYKSKDHNTIPKIDWNISRNITGRSDTLSDLVNSQNVTSLSNTSEVKYAIRKQLKSKHTTAKIRSSRHRPTKTASEHPEDTMHSTPCHVTRSIAKCKQVSVIKHKILAQTIKEQISQMNQKEGKEAILQKYFSDYLLYRSPSSTIISTKYRERGDGADSHDEEDNIRHGDGSNCPDESSNISNALKIDTENTSYVIDDVTSDSGQEDGEFDNAFIDDSHIENDAPCLRRLVDYSITESDISDMSAIGHEDSNDISTLSSISDIVKSAFSENVNLNEDDVMASFMDSKVSDENSDEGLSSLGSEDDREKEFVV